MNEKTTSTFQSAKSAFRYILPLLHLIFFIFHFSFYANAQSLKGITFEPNLHYGRIIKHTGKFAADIQGNTFGLELNLIKKTYGKQDWQTHQGYPAFGLAVSYFNFGDKKIFGSAFGLVPNFTVKFLQNKKRLHGHFRLGVGAAYLNQIYNVVDNAENNAIGSHLNAMITFRLGTGYRINDKWVLQSSVSYNHFSNGASTLPNLGLNIPTLNIGATYTPQPLKKEDFLPTRTPRKRDTRTHISLMQAITLTETITPGGPKYPTHITTLSVGRHLGYANRMSVGFEYEFNYAVYEFMNHIGLFETQAQRRRNASRATFFVVDEVTLGNVSLWFQAGTYLTRSYQQQGVFFTKLGVRYYVPLSQAKPLKTHFGVYIKAHQVVAEYVCFGVGLSF